MTVLQYSSADLLRIASVCVGHRLDSQTVSTCRLLGLMKKTKRGKRVGVRIAQTHEKKDSVSTPAVSLSDSSVSSDHAPSKNTTTLHVAHLNARSAASKPRDIHHLIVDKQLDVLCLTETWLKENGDEVAITDMTPPGYAFHSSARHSRGGGVAVVYRSHLKVKIFPCSAWDSCETIEFNITVGKQTVHCVCVYRSGNKKYAPTFRFCEEMSTYLSQLTTQYCHFIVVGDFNIHYDNPSDTNTKRMNELFDSLDLRQLVNQPTHLDKHILDWVIVRSDCGRLIQNVTVEDVLISDHYLILLVTNLARPRVPRKRVECRNFKDVDTAAFKRDLEASRLVQDPPADVDELVDLYNETITAVLDKHAPVKVKFVPDRPPAPWYSGNENIQETKCAMRRAERKWRKSKLEIDRQIYKQCRNKLTDCLKQAKRDHIQDLLREAASDLKKVFSIVNGLLGHPTTFPVLPDVRDRAEAASLLSLFFADKVEAIRANFAPASQDTPLSPPPLPFSGENLAAFSAVSSDTVSKILLKSRPTTSLVDPIPTRILKEHLDVLLPTITLIINKSLSSGTVPKAFKSAVVKPLLKKPSLDPSTPKNFRPVSNLPFLSKVLERTVAEQLLCHLNDHHLLDKFQSAYRAGHSTETALVRIMNDLLCYLDGGDAAVLLLLDLSAAFDTIDHAVLLQRLSDLIGVSDVALDWFHSYLQDRWQFVSVDGASSASTPLQCGVPQGSVLGPILFSIYTIQLGTVIDAHGIPRQHFADDSQLYNRIPAGTDAALEALQKMEDCVIDVKSWMFTNKLKLNDDKSEALRCQPSTAKHSPQLQSIQVGSMDIPLQDSVKSLGLTMDAELSMINHVNCTVKSCFYFLRLLSKLRPCLDRQTANTVAVSLVHSRLDYCNATLWGISESQLNRLQHVQNVASRIVTCAKRTAHTTPILKDLHWLPVGLRIEFKVICLAHSCIHGTAPQYLSELVPLYRPTRSLRSSSRLLLPLPGYYDNTKKKRLGARSFKSSAPTLWNRLPPSLQKISSTAAFKRRLKTHLFSQF